MSFVDLNRSGVALMEIVSKPDLRSADEAKAYVSKLRTILRYLGTCDGDMEKGSLRADVNVSVRRPGEPFGTRCEIKNVNSIRFIGQAIEYEARRQVDLIEDGGTVEQETRLFDPNKGETRPMRTKEEAHDYRYFPDPDLLAAGSDAGLGRCDLKAQLPELPDQKKARFMRDYALTAYDANVLIAEREAADYLRGRGARPRRQGGGQLGDQRACRPPQQGRQGHPRLAGLVGAARRDPRSDRGGNDFRQDRQGPVRDRLERGRRSAARSSKTRGMKQVTDLSAIEKVVDEIVAANPDKVEQARTNPKLVGWFVGQAMKASGGKANPQAVNDLLKRKLGV